MLPSSLHVYIVEHSCEAARQLNSIFASDESGTCMLSDLMQFTEQLAKLVSI